MSKHRVRQREIEAARGYSRQALPVLGVISLPTKVLTL